MPRPCVRLSHLDSPYVPSAKSEHALPIFFKARQTLIAVPAQHRSVTDFGTKEDLIQACLASVHIPFFLDGRVRLLRLFPSSALQKCTSVARSHGGLPGGGHAADWTDAWAQAFSGHRGATCVDGSLTFVLRGKAWHFAPDDPEVPLSTTPFYSTTPPCAGRGHVTVCGAGRGGSRRSWCTTRRTRRSRPAAGASSRPCPRSVTRRRRGRLRACRAVAVVCVVCPSLREGVLLLLSCVCVCVFKKYPCRPLG